MSTQAPPAPTCEVHNPTEQWLRMDRIPHIWCPGCGIGSSVNCFTDALEKSKIPRDNVSIVSGIGCTGRTAGYLKLDSFHTTHGRPIAFATGLKLANPKLKVVVYSGDGDLFAIGGNHFIHAARRNMDMTVICVNNMTYGMTGGQVTPTTPLTAKATTSPYGNFEEPFNLPYLAESCGAVYVARWTSFHVRQLSKSIREALLKPGFTFIEVVAPCPTLYARRNRLGAGIDAMKYYREQSEIKNGAPTRDVALGFQSKIICGKFVDTSRPTWLEAQVQQHRAVLGDKFTLAENWEGVGEPRED
ncbi:2-oxoacid:ferredoxin oxidoreductase subunit beta [Candidatus Sumerlaeota bacterium]|nr:2-oxoacid:ferredoxin oxidoreductase subunit beta [Candidatus Sumerlaeota bacterium]